MMHSSLRCSNPKCCISWPPDRELYSICPNCGEATETLVAASPPLGEAEAKEKAAYMLFERWLEHESAEERVIRRAGADEHELLALLAGRQLTEEFDAIMEGITDQEWFRMHFEILESELALLD